MIANRNLILDETFMMGMFDDMVNQLPSFEEYFHDMYQNKKTAIIVEQHRCENISISRMGITLKTHIPVKPYNN